MENRKLALIILDGWGIGKNDTARNAIAAAKKPFFDSLIAQYPHASLLTFGENVGLPHGQMGNSEVGHINIGAGRVVYQQLELINKSFREHEIDINPVLLDAFEYAKLNHKKIHLLGLVSNGGVHSSLEHVKGLCEIAHKNGVKDLFIHAFTDGRDTDPKSGLGFIEELETTLKKNTGKIGSIIGRYYAMDRDKRWERIKLAYDLIVHGKGEKYSNASEGIKGSYEAGITDEFIKPIIINGENARIEEGDVVLFFNFRTDRGRELTMALSQQDFPEQDMKKLPLYFITMTPYDKTYKDVKILFEEQDLQMTLGEVIEKAGLTQLRAAETEKYPHVTFFFSGGREIPFKGERRIMAQSPKVATYDLQPSMSAPELTKAAIVEINQSAPDFMVLNYANADMVGHTGVFEAVVKAIETVDTCLKDLVNTFLQKNYAIIIIADHGNADYMVNDDGSPNTAHSMNLVPFIVIDKQNTLKTLDGRLADIAPTILSIMGVEIPAQMTGKVLVEK